MAGLFITASGTDVGKTVVTALLARQLRARGQTPDVLKPVLSGFDPATRATSDAGVLLSALDLPVTEAALDRMSPWRSEERRVGKAGVRTCRTRWWPYT